MNEIEFESPKVILADNDFSFFIQNEDILNMSDEEINNVFDSLYGYIMKDAVYPHLESLKNNLLTCVL